VFRELLAYETPSGPGIFLVVDFYFGTKWGSLVLGPMGAWGPWAHRAQAGGRAADCVAVRLCSYTKLLNKPSGWADGPWPGTKNWLGDRTWAQWPIGPIVSYAIWGHSAQLEG